jgi:hypothetical protein
LFESHFPVQTFALRAGFSPDRELSTTSFLNAPAEEYPANAQAVITKIDAQVVEIIAWLLVKPRELVN